jgi:Carboxypeptidase regulatory-like domain/TonB-dependent Receptor Plug Domain
MTIARGLAALAAVLLWCTPLAVRAAGDLGAVEVRVVEAHTATAVAQAQIALSGPKNGVLLTDGSGSVRFDELPPGVYEVRARKERYADARSERFQIEAGTVSRVRIELPAYQVIGRVSAAAPRVTITSVDDASAVRRVSESLLDAMQNVAGVSLQADGSSISLRGFDPGQTGFSIDGIDIAGGVPGDLLRTGLFSGASVDFNPTARSVAGSVNYQTINPTQPWREHLELSYGSYDRSGYLFSTTGTSGKLGVALQHGWHGSASPLTGLTYQDTSGLDYRHDGASRSDGDIAKLSYALNRHTTLRLSAMRAGFLSADVCTNDTTVLPCGYGPGVLTRKDFAFFALVAESLAGNVSLNAAVYDNLNRLSTDASSRYVAGRHDPFDSLRNVRNGGMLFSASATQGRHTLNLRLSRYRGTNDLVEHYAGATSSSASRIEGHQATLSDAFSAGSRLKITGSASLAGATGIGRAVLGSAGVEWKPQRNDTFGISASSGISAPNLLAVNNYSDPAKADIDCYGRSAFVQGPSEPASAQHSSSVQLSARHAWSRGEVRATAYDTRQYGTTFYGALPLAGAAAGAPLPNGYANALQQTWSAPAVCGNVPFDPARAFAYETLSKIGQRFTGVTADGRALLGRSSAAYFSYGVTGASITHVDSSLIARGFLLPPGRQLPGRPLHTASVTLSAVQPRAQTEYIVNLRYVGTDNVENQNPYRVVNAGIVKSLRYGKLSLLESNVFNADGGVMTTYRGINPFPLAGGGFVAFPTSPLPPRQFTLRYAVGIGQ